MNWAKKKITLLIAFVLLMFCTQLGIAEIQTNEKILENLLTMPILTAVDSLIADGATIHIKLTEKNTIGKWLSEKLREKLLHKNYRLTDSLTNNLMSGFVVVVESVKSDIKYGTANRNIFFKTSEYNRQFSAQLSFYLKKKNQSIIYSSNKNYKFKDILKQNELKQVENKVFPFTIGTKMESKFIKRLMEPMLVTVATVGVVYLFYSLRGSSE